MLMFPVIYAAFTKKKQRKRKRKCFVKSVAPPTMIEFIRNKNKRKIVCGVCHKVLSESVFKNHLKHEHIFDIAKDLNMLEDIATTSVDKREEVMEIFVFAQFTRSGIRNLCKLCIQEVKEYKNMMSLHMK